MTSPWPQSRSVINGPTFDRKGNQVTQAVYDAVYGGLDFMRITRQKYASPLLNGYAAICRDGKWGVLDAAGKEYIPCDYAGAA